MAKPRELAVRIGSYKAQDGTTKGVYRKVGTEIIGKDGRTYWKVDGVWLNPAIPLGEDGGVLMSVQDAYDPEGRAAAQGQAGQQAAAAATPKPVKEGAPFDDEIPF